MVSLLKKPISFAALYVIFAALLGMSLNLTLLQKEISTLVIAGVLVLFTAIYVFLVKAQLSNHFRLYASIYIALLSLLVIIGGLALMDINALINALIPLLKDYHLWLNTILQFVFSYIAITIGNWLAGFALKTKGHHI